MTAKVALLLEDEALIALDVEQCLAAEGFEVVSFMSGADGLAFLETNTPKVAVLDVTLADGDCEETAAMLVSRCVPFVVYSAGSREAKHRRAFATGRWLAKPSTREELTALIREMTPREAGVPADF